MITAAILFMLGVVVYAASGNGEWDVVVLSVVLGLLVLMMRWVSRRDTRAYWNWVDYWQRKH